MVAVTDEQRALLAAIQLNAELAMQRTAGRDDLIRDARAVGLSLRLIAEAAGLSHTAVANICKRGTDQ